MLVEFHEGIHLWRQQWIELNHLFLIFHNLGTCPSLQHFGSNCLEGCCFWLILSTRVVHFQEFAWHARHRETEQQSSVWTLLCQWDCSVVRSDMCQSHVIKWWWCLQPPRKSVGVVSVGVPMNERNCVHEPCEWVLWTICASGEFRAILCLAQLDFLVDWSFDVVKIDHVHNTHFCLLILHWWPWSASDDQMWCESAHVIKNQMKRHTRNDSSDNFCERAFWFDQCQRKKQTNAQNFSKALVTLEFVDQNTSFCEKNI